jgi:threonine aldolase
MNFASDNVMGASAPVLDAVVRANAGALPAYGADEITKRVERRLAEIFERDAAVFLVSTGTAANALALATLTPPWGLCLSHEEAHVIEDEFGAPEFYASGAKLAGLPGVGAKLAAGTVADYLERLKQGRRFMPPHALSIAQATECGLVYAPGEIAALAEVCRRHGLKLHMDGARFANGLVAAGCSPAELTWKAGVDILSFGGTKNGCLAAEAVIVFERGLADTLGYRVKRGGHVLSKSRLIAAQLEGYLAEDHWLESARHANRMAARLGAGLTEVPGVRLAWPVEANEVFPILPRALDRTLKAAGAVYHTWSDRSLPAGERVGPDEVLVRLVTSFATEEGAVDRLLLAAGRGGSRAAAE